ncbi:MAG TPA: hypothetical protein P5346_01830 [Spirochaetota bacterium]|nr:hypothetical protein [Spirochaetota bacterium]HSA13454.1 hypothetical protein [Spirochaetota bacterium]
MENEKLLQLIEELKREVSDLKAQRKGFWNRAFSRMHVITGVLVSALAASTILFAAQITFTDGDLISADEVNANFTELYNSIAALETSVSGYNTLLSGVTRITDNGEDTIRFTGMNVQIVSGSGTTNGTVNGTGNLIVGYNEARTSDSDKSGSHNIVAGYLNNYSSFGGFVVGVTNTISGPYSSVSAGNENTASGSCSSVSGGWSNSAEGQSSSVSGGCYNTAEGDRSSVSAGYLNTASGQQSSVSGGEGNAASGSCSSVSGGNANTASGGDSSVSGGNSRSATATNNWAAGSLSESN